MRVGTPFVKDTDRLGKRAGRMVKIRDHLKQVSTLKIPAPLGLEVVAIRRPAITKKCALHLGRIHRHRAGLIRIRPESSTVFPCIWRIRQFGLSVPQPAIGILTRAKDGLSLRVGHHAPQRRVFAEWCAVIDGFHGIWKISGGANSIAQCAEIQFAVPSGG